MWPGIERLQSVCLGMILLDMETISPVEEHLFTPREAAKAMRMGPRRRKGFTAARVALKRLARQLNLVEKDRPDRAIETLGPDGVRPCLSESGIYCSVSHSARLVVAVAHRHPIGVDLEMVSEKVIRTKHLFMSPREEGPYFAIRFGPGEGCYSRLDHQGGSSQGIRSPSISGPSGSRGSERGGGGRGDEVSRKDLSCQARRRERTCDHSAHLRRPRKERIAAKTQAARPFTSAAIFLWLGRLFLRKTLDNPLSALYL